MTSEQKGEGSQEIAGLGKILSKCIKDKIQIHEGVVSLDTSDTFSLNKNA